MSANADIDGDLPKGFGEFVTAFVVLVLKSPVAIVTIVLSALCGYGIAFILFDYRRSSVKKSHYIFHLGFGLGYAALIFSIVNFDILTHSLTIEQISSRMPLTLLVSFAAAFAIMLGGGLWREFSASAQSRGH